MSNYYYTLVKKTSKCSENPNTIHRHIIFSVDSVENVENLVFSNIVQRKRESRFNKLFKYYDKDINTIYKYLPDMYKCHFNNLEGLKESLCTLHEIMGKYDIYDIELAPECFGCLNGCGGQYDHMECPTGCLHEKDICSFCDQK